MTKLKTLLKITCPEAHSDLISCLLIEAGSAGVEERDASTMTAAVETLTEIIAGFETGEDEAAEIARGALDALPFPVSPLTVELLGDIGDEWKTKWRAFFSPQVLSKLQVITPWMKPPRTDRISIVIDPGQAFGTGGHNTTRLILEMLEARAEAGTLARRAADIGSGSGILAIAARKLGTEEVIGVDIEKEAVDAFFENAERNGVLTGLDCKLGSASALEGTWPLVLANIQIDVFRIVAQEVAALVEPGGEVLISGLLLDQVDECLSLFSGFSVAERRESGEWAALALIRDP